jgi:hypothetical protein
VSVGKLKSELTFLDSALGPVNLCRLWNIRKRGTAVGFVLAIPIVASIRRVGRPFLFGLRVGAFFGVSVGLVGLV